MQQLFYYHHRLRHLYYLISAIKIISFFRLWPRYQHGAISNPNLGPEPKLAGNCWTAALSVFPIHTSRPAPPASEAEAAKQYRRLLCSWRPFLKYFRRVCANQQSVLTNTRTSSYHMWLSQSKSIYLLTCVLLDSVLSTEFLTENTRCSTPLIQEDRHWKWCPHSYNTFT